MNKIQLAGACLLFLISCGKKKQTYQALVGPITESVYASGTIISDGQYQVFPKSSGILEKIHFQEGDTVNSKNILFTISNDASKLSKENASLAAEFADLSNNQEKIRELEISTDLARKKYQQDSLLFIRQKKLWSEEIGSKLQLEQSELNFYNSRIAYQSLLLRLKELKKQLSFSDRQSKKNLQLSTSFDDDRQVKSMLNGKIYTILKEEGEMVSPQTPLAIIGSANSFHILLQVDEYDIVKIKTGQLVYIKLDSYKGRSFKASITKINPLMNERTKTFVVEAEFIDMPPVLYPNLTVEANIVLQTKEKALTIPRSYLINDSFVLDKDEKKIYVKTGLKDYNKVEILEGINEKDELVIP